MDKIEALYQTGLSPEDALSYTFLGSKTNMTIADDDGQPIGLCGVQKDGCISVSYTHLTLPTKA